MTTLHLALFSSALATAGAVALAVRALFRSRELAAAVGDSSFEAPPTTDASFDTDAAASPHFALARLSEVMRPKTAAEASEQRKKLARAGLRTQESAELWAVARLVALAAGACLAGAVVLARGGSFSGFALALNALALGMYGPALWLRLRTSQRQGALAESLPPTLDLLVTCMEAGLSLEQALRRVAGEVGYSDPEMAEELGVIVAELRAGVPIAEAFRHLAERVTAEEVRLLAGVIAQSATLGAALGRTLREYAASGRRRRVLGLEERAGKVTAGLTLPLALCLMPSAVLAMLGPAIVIIIRTLFS